MEAAQRPIFGLIQRLGTEFQREALLLVDHLRIQKVGGLAEYSRQGLQSLEVSVATLEAIESILKSEYSLGFAEEPKREVLPPRHYSKPERVIHASVRLPRLFFV